MAGPVPMFTWAYYHLIVASHDRLWYESRAALY